MAGAGKNRQRKERKAAKTSSASGGGPAENISLSNGTKISPKQRSPPSAWDGNRDPGTGARSRAGSDTSNRSGCRSSSVVRSDAGQREVIAARMPRPVNNLDPRSFRNLDLGMAIWSMIKGADVPRDLPHRPKIANNSGREVIVKLNTFHVLQFPFKNVYQYDVLIGSGVEKRGLIKKLWQCKTVQAALGKGWIYDGNRIAWSLFDRQNELNLTINLDKEQSKPVRPGKIPNEHRVHVRKSGVVNFQALRAYLNKQADFDNSLLEAISFLDHLMRETPTQKHVSIKRSFFQRGETRTLLGSGVEAIKGVYSSIRMTLPGIGMPPCLTVNVDVANKAFWVESPLHIAVQQILQARDAPELARLLQCRNDNKEPPAFVQLSKMKRVKVYVKHRGDEGKQKVETIERFCLRNAQQWTFRWLDPSIGREREITVEDYFLKKHGIRLNFPHLPLVKTVASKSVKNDESTWVVHPMEVLYILDSQQYNGKLSERQTSEMIKFAVTLPNKRWEAIEHGLRMLDWQNDSYLANYGLKIDTTPTKVKARVLPNPKVVFGQGSKQNPVDPRTGGRWDLKDKKFFEPGQPLKSWGVCIVPGRDAIKIDQAKAFITTFVTTLQNHGMKVENKQPPILLGNKDIGLSVVEVFKAAGNAVNQRPQFLLFIVPDKDSHAYMRIKKSCDCRYGVVSQVVQSAHAMRAQPQYCSNVAMKVNAKLGGVTAKAESSASAATKSFKVPTVIIGADVSHSAPGADAAPSIAAMTVSFDRSAIRYVAAVETNGHRVEIITSANIESMLKPLLQDWVSNVGKGTFPEHIIYFRDGVSEGQYLQVLQEEVQDIEKLLRTGHPKGTYKFTVIVATKRHHVRFFPEDGSGDKNGNPLPGTLVETGATNPFEYDFYLCAHSAIKGTARPVHYHVLRDDMQMSISHLQGLIYEHSYQYVRSTTPVSLFPAVYYAHLASNRGLHHIDEKAGSGPRAGSDNDKKGTSGRGSVVPTEAKPLLVMPNITGIRRAMWFV